jgi:hypothetical protein
VRAPRVASARDATKPLAQPGQAANIPRVAEVEKRGGAASPRLAANQVLVQAGLACAGTMCFCIWAKSWQDLAHLLYDIPANLAVFAFIAHWLLEGIQRERGLDWWCRLALIAAMTTVTVGRAYFGWNISGHLSCVGTVALVQLAALGIRPAERWFYCLPLPFVLVLRWFRFDNGDHWQTYSALMFSGIAATVGIACSRLALRSRGARV